MGFSLGVYVGTIYDCKPTVLYIKNFLDKTIPDEAKPKKNNFFKLNNYFLLNKEGILYEPPSLVYLAIILGSFRLLTIS